MTNRKAPARRGKVQLIDATSFWVPMRKSLGDKRREIPLERAQDILQDPRRLQGRRHADGREGRQGRGRRRQPDLPDDPLRLPQDHRRAAAPAQLPGEPGAHRPPRGGEGLPGAGAVEEEGRRGREGAGRRARAAGGDPQARPRAARTRSSRTGTSSSACSTAPRRRPA